MDLKQAATFGGIESARPLPHGSHSLPSKLSPQHTESADEHPIDTTHKPLQHHLKPAPGQGEGSRFERRVGRETSHGLSGSAGMGNIKTNYPYIVIGIFDGVDRWPKERVIVSKHPSLFLLQIWWGVVRLRGISYVLSLKDVKKFRLYKYNWEKGVDEHLPLSKDDMETLRVFYQSYLSWSPSKSKEWTAWAQESLNSRALRSGTGPPSRAVCLQVMLGWSPVRISVVILIPVLLSLGVGLWFQSRNPNDLATTQTAWTIASYITSSGALVAALLAVLSGIGE